MSDMRKFLVEAAARQCTRLCTPEAFAAAERQALPAGLWDALEAAGLPQATRSAARGGADTDLGDALAIVREAGRAALPAPLAETLLAELLLAPAGLAPRTGPLTVGPVLDCGTLHLERTHAHWELTGRVPRVPWARQAGAAVLLATYGSDTATVVVEALPVTTAGSNYAGEPRDDLVFDEFRLPDACVSIRGALAPARLRMLGAAFRAAAMAGALEATLAMTVRYAQEREQFGRPIGRFQAVQQQIAVQAAEVAAAGAAVDAMMDALEGAAAGFEIAAAKARAGEAAGIAAGVAHQVHGAMGFTHEHALHRSTRRLWAWRDEFGSEGEWAQWLGEQVAALADGEALWPFITGGGSAAGGAA